MLDRVLNTPLSSQPAFTCSKLTIKKLEQVANFEHIQHLVLVFLLFTALVVPLLLALRRSLLEVFCKKRVLKKIEKFLGKRLCQSLSSNNVLRTGCNSIKKQLCYMYFPVNFAKNFKTPFFKKTRLR